MANCRKILIPNLLKALLALLLLQIVKKCMCSTIPNNSKRSTSALNNDESAIHSGQPEEIFSIGDQLDKNYDEYPMIVPKRAALFLDRLMVALHKALEKGNLENERRLSEYFANKNRMDEDNDSPETNNNFKNNIYKGENVQQMALDYDENDLNALNRFQRGGNIDLGGSLSAADRLAKLSGNELTILSNPRNFRNSNGNSGRMYWRCYFNAVSCF